MFVQDRFANNILASEVYFIIPLHYVYAHIKITSITRIILNT